jgi:hypothetical protein
MDPEKVLSMFDKYANTVYCMYKHDCLRESDEEEELEEVEEAFRSYVIQFIPHIQRDIPK